VCSSDLTREGRFVQVSDSIPKKLAPVRGFVWYAVDVAYDVDRGRYDLAIREEGRAEPVVDLRDQAGAASQARSAVDVFSFISDIADASDVTYYVDDVSIATSRDVAVPPLVAPGRRKLFVDAFAEYRRTQDEKARCLPAVSLDEIGMDASASLGPRGLALLEAVLRGAATDDSAALLPPEDARRRLLRAAGQWREGCTALDQGDAATALERFESAAAAAPAGRIHALSAALALVVLGRLSEASDRLDAIAADWGDDARFAIVSARLAAARGDLATAQATLRPAAERGDPAAALRLYSLLSWDRQWREAGELATTQARRASGAAAAAWLERAGDAWFLQGDAAVARDLYEAAIPRAPDPSPVFLKLSDAAFVLGDLEVERRYRERYYGSLKEP